MLYKWFRFTITMQINYKLQEHMCCIITHLLTVLKYLDSSVRLIVIGILQKFLRTVSSCSVLFKLNVRIKLGELNHILYRSR